MAAQGTRVLLVDNYSSFTFNLYQYLAEVTGVLPRVVANDSDEELSLEDFHAVVLSPGPGTPTEKRDFGICRAMLTQERVPVLGVCLGHQGLGVQAGATLSPSAQPWHGRPSTIVHQGGPLFEGIPKSFRAIRYHSLVLHDPLPDSLECIARTDDDQVMALRHRTRPHWGVQFHPESIETEFGKELLANFCALSGPKQRVPKVAPVPAWTPDLRPHRWRMELHRLDHAPPAEELFACLFADAETSFWLDGAATKGYSFLGDGHGCHSYRVRYDQEAGRAHFSGSREESISCESIFSLLEEELAKHELEECSEAFSFRGGFVGYFGYELKKEVGASAAHQSHLPDAHWIWADRFVAYDHEQGRATLVCLVDAEEGSAADAKLWFDEVRSLLEEHRKTSPKKDCEGEVVPVLRDTRESYEAKIRECQERIAVGESYELCLTTHYEADATVDAWELFRIMRAQNPAPYSAFLRCGEFSIVSASPERFLRIDARGVAESKPIKGTARRDPDRAVDRELALSLQESEKERAENLMIVDLVRNDLGRNCQIGSVVVDSFAALESYATVHQLVSTIRGQLRSEVSSLQCVRDAFPGGSMTGAPKLRSMEILDRLEGAARGPYSGSIGYLSCDGAVDLSIVIRSVVVEAHKVWLGVGGAITALSESQQEFDEMRLKARAQILALGTLRR
jgi:para-aminobenzoate synthetase